MVELAQDSAPFGTVAQPSDPLSDERQEYDSERGVAREGECKFARVDNSPLGGPDSLGTYSAIGNMADWPEFSLHPS